MCGISGIFAYNTVGSFYMVNMGASVDRLAHRGPDGRGIFVDDLISLGHRRLSIIDLENGRQPLHDFTNRYVIVFNGEIFNYKQLQNELIAKGVVFNTQSDTEVLLNAYIYWGKEMLSRLSGFFAFAIYDKQTHELFVARDRYGVKPFYYYKDEDKFIFASEINSVLAFNMPKEINESSFILYNSLGYIPAPHTIYKDVYKLEAGTCAVLNTKTKWQSSKYYQLDHNFSYSNDSYEIAQEKTRQLIAHSIQDRMVADVPVAAFLSGGIDSSVVVCEASKIKDQLNTYSIGYNNQSYFDETKYAEIVAKKFNTKHHTIKLSTQDLMDEVLNCMNSFSEPFGDASSLPTYILSKKVSKSEKVALSGDGADELFSGYNKHRAEWIMLHPTLKSKVAGVIGGMVSWMPDTRSNFVGNKLRQLKRFARAQKMSHADRYWDWATLLNATTIKEVIKSNLFESADEFISYKKELLQAYTDKKLSPISQMLFSDQKMVLEGDMLVKVDRMSMANGLEVREPLLDYRLVDYINSLPDAYKINNKYQKRILRESYQKQLPSEIFNKPKQGFGVPLNQLFKEELSDYIVNELFVRERIEKQGLYNWKYIANLKNKIQKGGAYDESIAWTLVMFQHWYKKNIE
jgi:asparagine synthase (glutamine-hydrolysing)